jgi:nucleotide-binding universal stress UspA family protein
LHAGRAVRGALPLLRSAERVVVLQATRGLREALRESPSSPPEALQRYLHRHGVARSEAMRVDDEIGGPGVTEMLQALEVRLLVAGAFGRSRLREMVFGGSTRAFLEAVDGPSLLLGH